MKLFEELRAVEVKEETQVQKSDLEKVLEVEEQVLKSVSQEDLLEDLKSDFFCSKLYPMIYDFCVKELENIQFSSELLQGYVDARVNEDSTGSGHPRGYFSGALLEMLCRTNSGKHIFIDGRNKIFHYLFMHAKYVSHLTLKNVQGDGILSGAGIGGIIEDVFLENAEGYFIFNTAGAHGGKIRNVTAKNVKGDSLFQCAAMEGIGENITVIQVQGNFTFYNVGKAGRVTSVQAIDVQGNNTFSFAGCDGGEVRYGLLADSSGTNVLNGVRSIKKNNSEEYLPPVKKIILKNVPRTSVTSIIISLPPKMICPIKTDDFGYDVNLLREMKLSFTHKDQLKEYEDSSPNQQRIIDEIIHSALKKECGEDNTSEMKKLYREFFKEQ